MLDSVSSTDTRERILTAARELLEQRAWAGVGLGEVARAAGVSRQAIYLHFGSRAALLLALVDYVDEVEGLAELVARVDDASSGAEQLDRLAWLNSVYEPRIRSVVIAHDAARRHDADLEQAWQDRMERRRSLYRRTVRRLEAERALAAGLTRKDAVDLIWALLGPRVHEDLVGDRGWSARRYETHMRNVLRGALLRS
jgi:AcrR family transcriptional regulator